jgi:gluconokinase
MSSLPSPQYILALDIGTGSSRGLIIDTNLNILSTHTIKNNLYEPRPGWVEQVPDEVFNSTLQVIRQAITCADQKGIKISGICFSSAVSSLLAVNNKGVPISNALTWADIRAQSQVDELQGKKAWIYQRTGTPLHASYWLPKLMWLQKNQIDLVKNASHWMGITDYIVWRLTGEFATNSTLAAATGMLNLQHLQWDSGLCSLAGISPDQLPCIQSTTYIIPLLNEEITRDLGLTDRNLPIILGSGDGMLANLGSGVLEPGQIATTIGSSGACRRMSAGPVFDESMRIWSYPLLDDLWVIGGANNSGGLVVNWFQKQFLPDLDVNDKSWLQEAESIPAGSNGLIFLPYLFGERAPIWNESARGAFIGLDNFHTTHHMARAVLEGTIFALYDIYQVVCKDVDTVSDIRVSGGYTQSPLWLNIQANMFAKELTILESPECSAIGAGILGFYALGIIDQLHSATGLIKTKEKVIPSPQLSRQYQEILPLYTHAYQALDPIFENLKKYRKAN